MELVAPTSIGHHDNPSTAALAISLFLLIAKQVRSWRSGVDG